ncbi:5-bromo-4-chloroindolyl phosphate hydrolysis family protein [uncultured Oscillibacter sp.]|uniref:5-bromo-4-chloroindolyl phosphate hydrolysis family protein n=1 Tax=uncultured Oscillibacter sp. TaxID=876091 RepID=UPI0025F58B32|nr:5-bromo-4-chloroindolyl phosphate hydrolysis family protein [uncultured Oscillibacter sp.]
METSPRRSVAPFYAVAALWLAGGVLLPLYEPLYIGLLAAVSAAVFFGVNALCRGAAQDQPAPAAQAPKEEGTGDPALDKMLKDGRLAIAEMKRLDDNIADPGISADIVRLEQVSQKIFEEVRQDPKKLPQIQRFMDYYLPTTLKLLNSYDRMSGAGVSGENINATMAKVEAMMRTVVAAFEKQLDSLYGAEALDISTDITVLENMMAREGLAGEQLKAETAPRDGTDVRLEL